MPASLPLLVPDAMGTRTGTMLNQVNGTTDFHLSLGDESDGTYVIGGTEERGDVFIRLTDTLGAFGSMVSVFSRVRVSSPGGTYADDTVAIYAQIFDGNSTATALTNEVQVAFSNETWNGYTQRDVNHTIVGTPTKAQWDNAYVRLRWSYTRSMGADGVRLSISLYRMGGTFEPSFAYSGPITISGTGSLGQVVRGPQTASDGTLGHQRISDPIYRQTSMGVVAVFQDRDDTPSYGYFEYIGWLNSPPMHFIDTDWMWPGFNAGVNQPYNKFHPLYRSVQTDPQAGYNSRVASKGHSSVNTNERLYRTITSSKTNENYLWLAYTEDGENWVMPDTPIFSSTRQLEVDGAVEYVPEFGLYVMGTMQGEIYSSFDGLNWTLRTQDSVSGLSFNMADTHGDRMAFSPTLGRYVMVGRYYSGGYHSVVYYSNDGIGWVRQEFLNRHFTSLIWVQSKARFYMSEGWNTGSVWESTDGINWSQVGTAPGVANSIAYAPAWDLFFLATNAGLYTSPSTPTTWTQRVAENGHFHYAAAHGRAGFWGVSAWYSTNGTTWTVARTWTSGSYQRPVVCGDYGVMVPDSGRSDTNYDRDPNLWFSAASSFQSYTKRVPWGNPQRLLATLMPTAGGAFTAGGQTRLTVAGQSSGAYRHWRAVRLTNELIGIHWRDGHAGSSGYSNGSIWQSGSYVTCVSTQGGQYRLLSGTSNLPTGSFSLPTPGTMEPLTDTTFLAMGRSSGISQYQVSLFTASSTNVVRNYGPISTTSTIDQFLVKVSPERAIAFARDGSGTTSKLRAEILNISNNTISLGGSFLSGTFTSLMDSEGIEKRAHMFSPTEGIVAFQRSNIAPYKTYLLPFTVNEASVTFHDALVHEIPLGSGITNYLGNQSISKLGTTLAYTFTHQDSGGVVSLYCTRVEYEPSTRTFTNLGRSTLIYDLDAIPGLASGSGAVAEAASEDTLLITITGARWDRGASTSFATYHQFVAGGGGSASISQPVGGLGQAGTLTADNPPYVILTPRGTLEDQGSLLSFNSDTTQTISRSLARFVEVGQPFKVVYANERALVWSGTHFWTAETSSGTQRVHKYDTLGARRASYASPSANPGGLAWDGTQLFLSDNTSNIIYRINPTTGATLGQYNSPRTGPQGMAHDGTNLWVIAGNVVARLNPSTGAELGSFTLDAAMTIPRGLTWDGSHLWVSSNATGLVQKYTTTGALRGAFEHSVATPWGFTWDGSSFWLLRPTARTMHELDFYDPIPSDFASIGTMTWQSSHRLSISPTDDTYTLSARIVSADGSVILAAADAAGTFTTVGTVSGTTLTTVGPNQFAYLNQINNPALWTNARLELRQVWSATSANDGAAISVDNFELLALYVPIATGERRVETQTARPGAVTIADSPVYEGDRVVETDIPRQGIWSQGQSGVRILEPQTALSGANVAAPYEGPWQYLRPVADLQTGGWTTSSGAIPNLYQAIDDESDDVDHITTTIG